MTTKAIADKLVELCRQGKNIEAEELFYHPDVVSVEADGTEAKGIEAVKAKTQWFFDNHHIHSASIPEHYVGHNSFSVLFDVQVTPKDGARQRIKELGVYTVSDAKIVHEQFQIVAS